MHDFRTLGRSEGKAGSREDALTCKRSGGPLHAGVKRGELVPCWTRGWGGGGGGRVLHRAGKVLTPR